MKKIFFSLVVFLTLAVSVSFAKDASPVPERIAAALNVDFEQPANVSWKVTDAFYKASFTSGEQELEAFYNANGELMATSRNIKLTQLPLSLQKEVKTLAPGYVQEELFELLSDRGTEYFVKFGNGKEVKSYKSSGSDWVRY